MVILHVCGNRGSQHYKIFTITMCNFTSCLKVAVYSWYMRHKYWNKNMYSCTNWTRVYTYITEYQNISFHYRCPVDPSIFPSFTPDGNALQSIYEAFRFTESYGVIFQCNVKYCLGPCEPVNILVNQTDLTSTDVFLLL